MDTSQVIPCITLDDTPEHIHLGVPADDPAVIRAGPPLIDLAGDDSLDMAVLSPLGMDISQETQPGDHHNNEDDDGQ